MQPYRSVIADMLRERNRLLEQLYSGCYSRDEVLSRLRQIEQQIEAEENRGPRAYLDHIFRQSEKNHQEERGYS
ncbi:MAG: hypothetical protein AB1327_02450 [Bacillota bacterium]|uniref:hypothetical protein n=1 Tax=Desulforudis sp. DRI-14 TaxID=3459793 RepID=UPI0034824AC7